MSGAGPISSSSSTTPISPSSTPAPAPAAAASATPAATAARGASTPGRMAAAAALSGGAPHNPTAAEVHTAAQGIPREWDRNAKIIHRSILHKLEGSVTDRETERTLELLRQLTPGEFMAVMDHLEQEPWKGNLNMLHKLMRRGVEDDQAYIADFARLAARQLGLDLFPAHSGGAGKHKRQVATAEAAAALLAEFECDTDANFGMDAVNALENVGEGLKSAAEDARRGTFIALIALALGIKSIFD